ncbi:MAG TPA: hypothetical protein VL981_01365 [Candidatus Methylacidiphilales bacterium]|nr:hypothetical protein [Candidatus Methylacidiphilales bacterium]
MGKEHFAFGFSHNHFQILRHARIHEDSKSTGLGLIEAAIADTRQNNLDEANSEIEQAITSIHNVIALPPPPYGLSEK